MSRRKNDEWTTPSKPISVEIAGITHQGHYQSERRMVRVDYRGLSRVTQRGQSTPEALARLLLAELVRGAPDE